jgi:hypothetical protein
MRMRAVRSKMTVASLGWMNLILLMFSLTIPSPSHATIFFDTSFETCTVGSASDFPCEGWDDFGQANRGHLEVTTSLAFSGTKSVKGTFDNINGSTQTPSISRSWTRVPHIFARFAFRESSGFQLGSNLITKLVRFKDDYGYPLVWLVNRYGHYTVLMEGPYDYAGTYILDSGVTPSQTSWDQVEFEWQLNTPGQSNGLMRLWVNGTLRAEQLGKQYIGPTSTSKGASGLPNPSTYLLKTAQIYIQAGLGSFYFDRFAVGDTRIGLATSTTSGDALAPATPTGVGVR